MPRSFSFSQVDVFSDVPLQGNPLAVVLDGLGLSDAEMQAIAREMNLSETTFVFPSEGGEADYRVRIFTPLAELPFAGHPTLGTAHALLESGIVEGVGEQFTLRQQTLAGIQSIDVASLGNRRILTMTQPEPSFGAAPAVSELAAALGVDEGDVVGRPETVSVGVTWHIVEIRGLGRVSSLTPDMGRLAEIERRTGAGTTLFCEGAEDPDCTIRVRSFAPGMGIPEDPVCGSGNGCVGAFRARRDEITDAMAYHAEQGIEVGRPGRVEVCVRPLEQGARLRVMVGGSAVTVCRGDLRLP